MKRAGLFFSIFGVGMIAWPALAADGVPEMMGFRWGKNAFNFEGMPTGAQPLRNLSRRPDGTANAGQLVGDYKNPILTPEAAAVVKQKGELAIAGVGFRNSQDQCRAIAPPFFSAMTTTFAMLQAKNGDITFISDQNTNTRHIRMNAAHPAKLVPSPMGDAVGHWEGDTLVIDTVGMKVDSYTSVDRFGTPQSDRMHVVERYRLIPGAQAKAQIDKYEYSEGTVGGGGRNGGGRDAAYDPNTSLKGLQLEVTMDDPKVFKTPLTARVTYRRVTSQWSEAVCADNPVEHYKDEWVGLPRANRPDF
jgi:hypothetical protein